MKRQTPTFRNLSPNLTFCKYAHQVVIYKAENWHALLHEQYFSKHYFLDICQCVFNYFVFIRSRRIFQDLALQTVFFLPFFIKNLLNRRILRLLGLNYT